MHPAIALQPVFERYRAVGPALYWTITVIGAVWCFLIVYGVVGYGTCANTGTVPCDAYSYSPAFLWAIAPIKALPFELFLAIWTAAHVAALAWLRAGWFLVVPGLNEDVLRGNVSTFIALF